MKRLLQIILVLAIASVIACAAGRHIRHGNEQFAAKDYEAAVKEYEQALAIESELANDDVFQERLRKARVEVLYKEGKDLGKRLQWDEAIRRYTRCLELDRSHAQAKEALAEARKESSKVHLQAGLSLASNGKLYEAVDELTLSVELDPDNRAAQDALDIALKAKEENERKAEEQYRTGMSHFQQKDWNKSLEEFRACVETNPGHVLARSKAREAQDRIDSAKVLYDRGMEFFGRKDWDPATDQFEAAIRVSPFFQEPRKRIEEAAESKKQAELFSLNGDAYFEEKRWDEAIGVYRKALDVDPNHALSKNRLAKALVEAAAKHSSDGLASLNEGDAGRAVAEFTSALECAPDFSVAREGLAGIFYRQGSDFETAGKPGNALIEFRKALLMDPDYANARQKAAAIEQLIAKRTAYKVALLPFSNRSKDCAVAENLSDRLLDSLVRRGMEHIEILERRTLNNILEKQRLSMNNLADPDGALPAGGIQAVGAIIRGQVSSFRIYFQESITSTSQKYQSGARQVKNYTYYDAQQDVWDLQDKVSRERDYVSRYRAEYNDAQSKAYSAQKTYNDFSRSFDVEWCRSYAHSKESSKYRNCGDVLATLGTLKSDMDGSRRGIDDIKSRLSMRERQLEVLERKLRSAQNRFLYTDAYIDVPVYSLWHYRIHQVTKLCSLSVTCQAVDVPTGSILFSNTAGRTAEDGDDYVDNPNPSAGVHGNPLNLKSDTELTNQVVDGVVGEIADHIAVSLETYGDTYFRLGNEAAGNGHTLDAVEQYVNFLYCCPKCDPSRRTEAMDFIKKARSYSCNDIEASDCEGYWGFHTKDAESQKDSAEEM
ncbi:MAG: tetratricopeptide repeat protein [Deltaproteobacteria bacterium]|nr:tetratricopeptide repeat protein [Deltaproteobacteria bacterium]